MLLRENEPFTNKPTAAALKTSASRLRAAAPDDARDPRFRCVKFRDGSDSQQHVQEYVVWFRGYVTRKLENRFADRQIAWQTPGRNARRAIRRAGGMSEVPPAEQSAARRNRLPALPRNRPFRWAD